MCANEGKGAVQSEIEQLLLLTACKNAGTSFAEKCTMCTKTYCLLAFFVRAGWFFFTLSCMQFWRHTINFYDFDCNQSSTD